MLIRRIYEVDLLVCPKCAGTMRMIALIQEPKVIDKILMHLRSKGRDARAGPRATGLSPPPDAAAAEATCETAAYSKRKEADRRQTAARDRRRR